MSTFLPKLEASMPTLSPYAVAGCVATAAAATVLAIEPGLRNLAELTLDVASEFLSTPELPCLAVAINAALISSSTLPKNNIIASLENTKGFLYLTGACGAISAIMGLGQDYSAKMRQGALTTGLSALGLIGLALIERSLAK